VNPVPIVCVADSANKDEAEPLVGHRYIQAVLSKPIKESDLELAIGVAVQRFEQFESLRQEVAQLRQALEERKIIERAKGMIMRYTQLSEEEAFGRLQKM